MGKLATVEAIYIPDAVPEDENIPVLFLNSTIFKRLEVISPGLAFEKSPFSVNLEFFMIEPNVCPKIVGPSRFNTLGIARCLRKL